MKTHSGYHFGPSKSNVLSRLAAILDFEHRRSQLYPRVNLTVFSHRQEKMWLNQTQRVLRTLVTRTPRALPIARTIATSRVLRMDSSYDENFSPITVNILHRELNNIIFVQSYSDFGFRLSTGVFALGPVAILPTAMFAWTVATHHDINVKSLSLFYLMEPKIDILIIGTGMKREAIDPEVREFLRTKKIALELQDTRSAISAYNYLAGEFRNVGVALIPPEKVFVESDEEALISYNIKRLIGKTSTTEDENVIEEKYLYDAFRQREFNKWWAGEYGDKPLTPGLTEDYQEKLKAWKARKVDEDDVERTNLEDFTQKSEKDLMKKREKALVENVEKDK